MKQRSTSFNSRADALGRARLAVACRPIWILAFVASAITCLSAASLAATKLPPPQGLVSDFAEKLGPAERQDLEARLKDFKDRSDGIEVAVVTIPYEWLGSLPLEKYSLQLARSWGIGARGKRKDGLLLLIAIKSPDDQGIYHGSTRLEVSRSLEHDLPSSVASGLIAAMHDDFVAGRFDQAAGRGVEGIIETLARQRSLWIPTPNPSPAPRMPIAAAPAPGTGIDGIFGAVGMAVLLLFVLLLFGRVRRGSGTGTSPGVRYGRNQPYWNNDRQDTGLSQGSFDVPGADAAPQNSFDSAGAMASADAAGSMGSTDAGSFSSGSDFSSSSSTGSDFGSSSGGGDFGGGGASSNW